MAAHQVSLSASDQAAVVDGFSPLETAHAGLTDRLVRYVIEGHDEGILLALTYTPDAASLLGIDLSYGGLPSSARKTLSPAWDALLEHPADVPVPVLVRFAKVMSAAIGPGGSMTYTVGQATVFHQANSALRSLSPPPWLELLVRLGVIALSKPAIYPVYKNRLSAEIIERMIESDGYSPEIIYSKTFPADRFDFDSMQVTSLLGGLKGFGEQMAKRPALVTAALRDSTGRKRALALEAIERLAVPVVPFLDDVARLATGPAKTLRDAATPFILRSGTAALDVLRVIAESGKPAERSHALRLIARLDIAEGKAFLKQRAEIEQSSAVRQLLAELMSEAVQKQATPPHVSEFDVFSGVALAEAARGAIATWAKQVAPADLEYGFTWLTQPTPWTGDPRPILSRDNSDIEGVKVLFQRPELTPLHVVRLLRLSGLLQVMPNAQIENKLDPRIPAETLDRLFGAYRGTHQPRMGLRELAAAFRASALDDDLIAWARLGDTWTPRFVWEDQATWPYFAERLDWLAHVLDSTASSTGMLRLYLGGGDRRAAALSLLATFPEPPPRFLSRLWELALGTSKVYPPLAQRILEKLPDCSKRVCEALASRDSQARKASAEWLARIKPEGAAEAIRKALESEKAAQAKAALAAALESLGGEKPGNGRRSGRQQGSRESLRREAALGLKKGIPVKHAWFPYDRLPGARWVADDTPVENDILRWLVVSAWKSKRAEPTVLLRNQVKLIREDDARRLGKFVLEAWLAEDLRPPTAEEVLRRLKTFLLWTGATTVEEIVQKNPQMAQAVEFEKNRPMSVRAEDKGILALVAACGPTDVVDRIRSYVNQWYGYRAAQCRALIQVLAWIDHPEAVAFLLDVAKRFRTASIRQEAESQARKLAERKKTTLADLAEQSLPDAGFDTEGKLVLDFGRRKFIARLDDDAELLLEDEYGTEIKALPTPGKNDNAELAAAAKKRLSEVKKELKAVAQTRRRAALRGDVYPTILEVCCLEAFTTGPPGRGPALPARGVDAQGGIRTRIDIPSARGRDVDGSR